MKAHKRSFGSKAAKHFSLLSLSGLGFSGWMIVILSVAILTFIVSIVINPGKAQRSQEPLSTVTLQILNGCGQKGAASSIAEALMPGDGSILYDLIEKGDTGIESFEKTVVVDRRGDPRTEGVISEEARRIAARLGIAEDQVILLRLEDNILDIDVTIIAGSDYSGIVEKLRRPRVFQQAGQRSQRFS